VGESPHLSTQQDLYESRGLRRNVATLTPERWQEISPFLDHALSLSEADRTLWLESFRAEKPELADLLQELLEEHRALSEQRFLEGSPIPDINQSSLAGQKIGAYKLISRIGEGGMGSVWLAERNDGRFERLVAIKFLRFSVASHGGVERFKREGSILGWLTSPHIAELIDAGVTPKGEPYLVLEHVEGEHIDEYCDGHALDVDRRIRIFADVLSAVAQAHAHLVVHRDIKPSNVLVRKDGHVKLLDFGIAKLLAYDATPALPTLLTTEGGGALTPQFAAPEQVTRGAVTTATDVYALGVLLYLLLTGQHPAGAGPHSPAELIKAIVETEPPRASEAVALAKGKAIADKRGSTPEKLSRQLRGDLDTIVAKTLKKNPAERYSTVTALADDLERYLRHEPISARPDTIAYRAAKFVRRNRTATALTAFALITVIGGLTATLLQARAAREQRDFAVRQLSRAEAINDLNDLVLGEAAPSGKPLTLDHLFEIAEGIVRKQHGTDENTRGELLTSIGKQYAMLEKYEKARQLFEEARSLSRSLPDRSTHALASCALGQTLSRGGDPARAEQLYREGIGELPDNSVMAIERITCLMRGSEIAYDSGSKQEALIRVLAAERLLQHAPSHPDNLELNLMVMLADAYAGTGQPGQADGIYRRAAIRLGDLGRDRTQLAGTLFHNWGSMLLHAGRPLDAQEALHRSIDVSRDNEGEDSVSPVTLAVYSEALWELGRTGEAGNYAERGYSKGRKDGDGVATRLALVELARIYRARGDLVRSGQMLSELDTLLHRSLPSGHVYFARLASELSLNARAAGDLPKALEWADRAVRIAEEAARGGSASSLYEGKFLVARSIIKLDLDRVSEAIADASAALPLLQTVALPGSSSSDVGRAQVALGRALGAERKDDQARSAFRNASELLDKTLGPDNPESREARQLAGISPQ
jgi:serine/threonine-protein kinase